MQEGHEHALGHAVVPRTSRDDSRKKGVGAGVLLLEVSPVEPIVGPRSDSSEARTRKALAREGLWWMIKSLVESYKSLRCMLAIGSMTSGAT